METVRDFIFFWLKITADGDCSHEIKRHLLLGRKAMTNIDSILKNRDITLPTKVHLVKAMVFPVVMYGYESWTIEKAECQRNDDFELWCWRRRLNSPLDCKEIQPEISPEYSLEGLVLKLKLQFFGHLMWRTNSVEKTLMLGKVEGGRRRMRMSWLGGITNAMGISFSRLRECVMERFRKELDRTEQLDWICYDFAFFNVRTWHFFPFLKIPIFSLLSFFPLFPFATVNVEIFTINSSD